MKYCAITGDLIKSREIEQRHKVQAKLVKILDKVNKNFRNVIVVKFTVTLGDEFQGLINSLAESYKIITFITKLIHPVEISFGVGEGGISTSIENTTSKMDGECFFRSREALEEAKKISQSVVYNTQTDVDLMINAIIRLIDAIRNDWKSIHYKRIWLYEKLGTLEKVAKVEKVTKQMISKMLIDIKYDKVKEAKETIEKFLSTV